MSSVSKSSARIIVYFANCTRLPYPHTWSSGHNAVLSTLDVTSANPWGTAERDASANVIRFDAARAPIPDSGSTQRYSCAPWVGTTGGLASVFVLLEDIHDFGLSVEVRSRWMHAVA